MGGLHFTAACLLVLQIVTIGAKHMCQQKPNRGFPCDRRMERYYFDSNTLRCKKFFYGGCGGNSNNFATKEICRETCLKEHMCRQKPNRGFCDHRMERYYFNSMKLRCRKFLYGGCGGNSNNFATKEICMDTCFKEYVCQLKPEKGFCSARVERYYFDSREQVCKTFLYRGCGSNGNNFDSNEICINTCFKGFKESVCEQKLETGNCYDFSLRYYFNSTEKTCNKFGGCGGNGNNFHSEKICKDTCFKGYICRMPKDAGPCKFKFPRYYYNKTAGYCERFFYGACGGNLNRFLNEQECNNYCMY